MPHNLFSPEKVAKCKWFSSMLQITLLYLYEGQEGFSMSWNNLSTDTAKMNFQESKALAALDGKKARPRKQIFL